MKLKKHIYCEHFSDYEIPFFDVDSMNIMWHGHYVKYFEMARCAFLEEIGYTYDVMREKGYAFPIVQLNLKYVKPALFRQKVRVHLMVMEYESSFRVEYKIVDLATGKKLTTGSTMQVAVAIDSQEMQFQTPQSWQRSIESFKFFQPIPIKE